MDASLHIWLKMDIHKQAQNAVCVCSDKNYRKFFAHVIAKTFVQLMHIIGFEHDFAL